MGSFYHFLISFVSPLPNVHISVAYKWAGLGKTIEFGEKMQSWKHVHVADIKSEYQDDQQNPPAVRRLPDSEWGTRYIQKMLQLRLDKEVTI